MKNRNLGIAVLLIAAITVFGLSGLSFAQEQVNGGPGDVLLFPYYDMRTVGDGGLGLTDNYFSIVNTSTQWVQSHVRIRTGDCSVEILDFDILQSPKDNFVFDIYANENGGITFASCDANTLQDSRFILNYDADGDGTNDCFVLTSETFPNMLGLITTCGDCKTGHAITVDQAKTLSKKGYVEVIEEGVIARKALVKEECLSAPVTIPGKSLRTLFDLCGAGDIYAPNGELQGRQYFVEVDHTTSPAVVKRLAQSNAAVLDFESDHGIFLHEDTYQAELNSPQCNDIDGNESCYAYVEPKTTDVAGAVVVDGANDMNYCFYVDKIGGNAVINKFGAGATFGPTLADVYLPRDGSLGRTAINLADSGLSWFDLVEYFWTLADNNTKQYVDSHYVYAPLPGPYDITTAFAFTFPLQHFIGEKATIKTVEIYDNSENTTTPTGVFLSPGLPSAPIYAEEAQLHKLIPPFNEGWIRFEVAAKNATLGCQDKFPGPPFPPCEVQFRDKDGALVDPNIEYVPAYMGLVFTTGAETLGVSPFVYNNDKIKWDDNGQWGDTR